MNIKAKPASPRRNLLDVQKEHWIPPVYSIRAGLLSRIKLAFFRFLDLQAGSIHRDLASELPQVKGTVVDAGCGLQPFRRMFPSGTRYIGLDTVDSKSHFGYEAPDTIYYSGTVWPLKSGTVDFILCTETLEHIAAPLPFLKEAFRCLRPGGRLLLTVPFEARWHFIRYDYWRYTPSGLDHLLKSSGFSAVRIFARGNQWTVACYKIMAVIFSLLLPVSPNPLLRLLSRLTGSLSLPILLVISILANLSLVMDGSVDCIGFTVSALKPRKAGRRHEK